MLGIRNLSDFSTQCFGYLNSDIVSDIRTPFWICYDTLPYTMLYRIHVIDNTMDDLSF